MTKKLVGLAMSPQTIGAAGADGVLGQYSFRNTPGTRQPGASSHPGAYLLELSSFVRKLLASGRYNHLAVVSAEYGINTKSFFDADVHARMLGVVTAIACECDCKTIELPPRSVSEMAIGRKGATYEDYQQAAARNGQSIKGLHASEAYWIMICASKE